jgi:HlyD family secretion protein
MKTLPPIQRTIAVALIALVGAAGAIYFLKSHSKQDPGPGFASGNGRIEATEIDIATKYPGRVQDILVNEGEFVKADQVLGHMQVQSLDAQREEARAHRDQAVAAVSSADAQVAVRESDVTATKAVVSARESDLEAARLRQARSEKLTSEGASSQQELDDDRARTRSAEAAVIAAKAQLGAAESAVNAAATQVAGAKAAVNAADATLARINVDINDSTLIAPRAGRVQYRIAEPGEVLGGGGKVLNMTDLSDVSMSFFVPENVAGRLAIGSDVRVILDAAPQYVIPAKISYVASTAQFTPKTVETASERQKLMFHVKARIDPDLLQKYSQRVKTGIPGVAWVKLDPNAAWPPELSVKVPQ